jgi:V8-like Glu-specific endopeptidase
MLSLVQLMPLLGTLALGEPPGTVPAEDPEWLPIVGGEPVGNGEWPEVVGFRAADLLCTGTLIAPRVILTAAHCFRHSRSGDEVDIFTGTSFDTKTTQPAEKSTVWAAHAAWCGDPDCGDATYDYAYIVLPQAIKVSVYPEPITHQDEWDQVMRKGTTVRLIGYGNNEVEPAGRKYWVDTTIEHFTAKGLQFETAGGGKDSCEGDSGGPAMIASADGKAWRLAGVLSSGSVPCGNGGWYGVPIVVLDWLAKETPYRAPNGACTSLDCLDVEPSTDSCSCVASGVHPTRDILPAFALLACSWWRARRRDATCKFLQRCTSLATKLG